jgi:hypothetical protein
MTSERICGCGKGNRLDRRFCGRCGSALGATCGACGFDNDLADRHCGGCGAGTAGTSPGPAPAVRAHRPLPAPASPVAPIPLAHRLAELNRRMANADPVAGRSTVDAVPATGFAGETTLEEMTRVVST